MNKLSIPFISFFLVFSLVFAQADLGVSAGLTPNSIFYFFDGIGEWISLGLTFNKAKKAEKKLEYASERLAELSEMESKGQLKQKHAEKLKNKYAILTAGADENLTQLKTAGKDVVELVKKMEDISARHTAVLEKVLEKVPEQAKDAIEHALEVSRHGHEKAIEAIKKEAEEGKIKLEDLKEEVKKEIKKRLEKTKEHEEQKEESELEEEFEQKEKELEQEKKLEEEISEMNEIEKEQKDVESMLEDIEEDNLKSAGSEVNTLEQDVK